VVAIQGQATPEMLQSILLGISWIDWQDENALPSGSVPGDAEEIMLLFRHLRCAALAIAVVGLPMSTWAALGGDATSVQDDVVHMKGALRTAPGASYTVHEISAPGGTVVREYISPQGKVFAVSWRGPFMPDLQQLLGTHFAAFQQSIQARTYRVRGPAVLETPGLVVQSAGHMRSFTGRAYLPDNLPQGVTAQAIR